MCKIRARNRKNRRELQLQRKATVPGNESGLQNGRVLQSVHASVGKGEKGDACMKQTLLEFLKPTHEDRGE